MKRGQAGVKLRPCPGMRGRVLGTNCAPLMFFRSPYFFLGVSDPKRPRCACGRTPVYAVSTRYGLRWKAGGVYLLFLLPPVGVEVAKNMRGLTDLSRLF